MCSCNEYVLSAQMQNAWLPEPAVVLSAWIGFLQQSAIFFSACSPALPAPIVDAAKFNFLSDQAILDLEPSHSNFHCSLDKQKALHRGLQDSYTSYKGFVRALSTSCPLDMSCGELPSVQGVPIR